MRYRTLEGISALLLCGCLIAIFQTPLEAQDTGKTSKSATRPNLTVEQVVSELQRRNAERAAALARYEGTRLYRMHYRGFPHDYEAEMVVHVSYRAATKDFTIVSQSGSKLITDRVFKRLLESEQEAANDENRRHTALSTENYDFTLAGYEDGPDGGKYVLSLLPKTKNKFLYRGQIWVDAKDFAVVRIKGEPAKNPSFWIKKTEIEHRYTKIREFWLPAENRTESLIRLGGVADLSIQYTDYKVEGETPGAKTAGTPTH
jgi:hypothetical protein